MGYKCGVETKKGTPCKHNVIILGSKCNEHNDSKILCIGITKKKEKCKSKNHNGTKYCYMHRKQNQDYKWVKCVAETKLGKPCSYEANVENGLCTLHVKLTKRKPLTEKKCTECGKIKSLKSFVKNRKCKECINFARRELDYPRKECGTKTCAKCDEEKDISCFTFRRNITDGLHSYCKECTNSAKRASNYLEND
uniref:HNH endonuclease n=1 Tax=Pithovirus LCPAC401 TaxID=2506595 RepID=A0A481ZBS0_9VIRU|nr:MAG: uncharacterized protein LCPAC401_02180 [Pithovirus LCPAC401]